MPQFPNRKEYGPTEDSLKLYQQTKKEVLKINDSLTLPGYNISVDVEKNRNWFIVAMVGELAGLILTIFGGMTWGLIIGLTSVAVVFILILVDLFLAGGIRKQNGSICFYENSKQKHTPPKDDNDSNQIKAHDESISRAKGIKLILSIFLYLIATVKTLALFAFGVAFGSLAFVVAMGIYFFLIAYVHSKFTPFHRAYVDVTNAFRKDSTYFKRQPRTSTPFYLSPPKNEGTQTFSREKTIDGVVSLIRDEASGPNYYVVQSLSILYDSDIKSLSGGLAINDAIAVAKACHQVQLQH